MQNPAGLCWIQCDGADLMLDCADLWYVCVCVIVRNGAKWCRMVSGAAEWLWMVRNTMAWYRTLRDSAELCGMVRKMPNGAGWCGTCARWRVMILDD